MEPLVSHRHLDTDPISAIGQRPSLLFFVDECQRLAEDRIKLTPVSTPVSQKTEHGLEESAKEVHSARSSFACRHSFRVSCASHPDCGPEKQSVSRAEPRQSQFDLGRSFGAIVEISNRVATRGHRRQDNENACGRRTTVDDRPQQRQATCQRTDRAKPVRKTRVRGTDRVSARTTWLRGGSHQAACMWRGGRAQQYAVADTRRRQSQRPDRAPRLPMNPK